VSYVKMRDALQETLERVGHARAKIEGAKSQVIAAMAAGRLTGWGTRADRDGAGQREPIPPHVLSDPELEVTSMNRLGSPLWRGGPVYSAVSFQTAEVLVLWPAGVPPEGAGADAGTADPAPTAGGVEASAGARRDGHGTGAKRKRSPRGFDYRDSDALLAARMRRMLTSGNAKTVWDAALQLAGEAAGHGTAESKAKRLTIRYSDIQSRSAAERDGED
jgi:hypothetical protein